MMTEATKAPDELIDRACNGDDSARPELLELYRDHLRRMVAVRLDRRLRSRIDASDVVQETLTEASGRLDEYLRDRPIPFLPGSGHSRVTSFEGPTALICRSRVVA